MSTKPSFKVPDLYGQLLDSFSDIQKVSIDLNSNEISKAIFLDLVKMKYADWRMKVNFNRHKRHSYSELFQDVIAYYLNCCLPSDYEIELEKNIRQTQPDIAIKKNDKYLFLIELKTNIGFARPDMTAIDPYSNFKDRVDKLSSSFEVSRDNIIYIFEDPGNVSRVFLNKYWDSEAKSARLPKDFPFSVIKPLFKGTDPYYWQHEKEFNRRTNYKTYDEAFLLDKAEHSIITKFESVISLILNAKQ